MRRLDVAWLLVWAALSSAWCLTAAPRTERRRSTSRTTCAPGVTSWRTGSNRDFMRAGTMPLPLDVEYLPIYWWERARGREFDVETAADFHAILPYARAMSLPFLVGLLDLRHARWPGRSAARGPGGSPSC